MTNGPFTQATLLKKSCLNSKANKQVLAKQKQEAKQSFLLMLKKNKGEREIPWRVSLT